MKESTNRQFTVGNRVRVSATGHPVTIQKISPHDIAIIEYKFGYSRMVKLSELTHESMYEERHVA